MTYMPYAPDVYSQRGARLATTLERFATARGERGFTMIDLIRPAAACGASVSELVSWLAHARGDGTLEDVGFTPDSVHSDRFSRRYRVIGAGE